MQDIGFNRSLMREYFGGPLAVFLKKIKAAKRLAIFVNYTQYQDAHAIFLKRLNHLNHCCEILINFFRIATFFFAPNGWLVQSLFF